MKPTSWRWAKLHDLFDTDDGSLPEIHVNYATRAATVSGYDLLRRRAARVVTEKPYFWSKAHDAECALDSVSNAAAFVVTGEAEPFHVVLGGIQTRSTTIPDLGVFVFPNQLAMDYRMGPAWGASALEALFQVLVELVAFDPSATVSLEENVVTSVAARFQTAWGRWASEHAA